MTSTPLSPRFFTLSESRALGAAVCCAAGLEPTPLEERDFEGGEFKLRPLESVRDRTVFVLQILAGTAEAPVARRLLRLLFLLSGLRDAGARRRIALLPYLAFGRKDRRTQVRDPVYTRYVAELLEAAHVDAIVTLDAHNAAALENAFRIPVEHLSAQPLMVDHFARACAAAPLAVVSPDIGGIKRAQVFRERLEARLGREIELAFLEKRRAGGIVSGGALVGEVAGRTVIVLDDLCATGGTLIRAADICRHAGAAEVHVTVTHAPLAAGVHALLAAGSIARVVLTDSAGTPALTASAPARERLCVLSVAPLLGEAVRRLSAGDSLAPLLERWPVGPEG